MDENTYLRCVACHFMCDMKLAEKLVKSAELNGTKKEMDRIAQLKEKELDSNASQFYSFST